MTERRSTPEPGARPNREHREPHRPLGRPDRTARTRILDGPARTADGAPSDRRAERGSRRRPAPTPPARRRSESSADTPPVRLTVVPGGRDRSADRADGPRLESGRTGTTRPQRPEPRGSSSDRDRRLRRRSPAPDREWFESQDAASLDGSSVGDGRIRRLLGRGRLSAVALVLVLLGVAATVIAQPLRQWRDQQKEISVAERRLADVRAERETVQDLTEKLRSDSSIRRHARELLDMVDPGEELVIVLPPGSTDLGLPDAWPFTGVERELGTG